MAVETVVIDGAEVRVETGVGKVIEVKPKGDRNAQVIIDADHLRENVTGWVDRQGPVWPRVEYAHAHGIPVFYRVEVKRKRDVAKDKPLGELGNREKVRDLVAIEKPENAPAHAPGAPAQAGTGEKAPAAATGPANGTSEQRPTPLTAALAGLAQAVNAGEAPQVIEFMRTMATDLGATPEQLDEACRDADLPAQAVARAQDPDRVAGRAPTPTADEAASAPPARPGPAVSQHSGLSRQNRAIATDGKPWEQTNSDGRLNLSSYAAGAVADFVALAGRLLITRARQRAAEDATFVLAAPSQQQVQGLAATLLNVADVVQHQMRDGGRVDRMASSHKLARQAVREALDLFPVPWGADDADRAAWKKALIDYAGTQVAVIVELLNGGASQ